MSGVSYYRAVSRWTGTVAEAQITRDWRDWVGLAARLILGISLFYAGALKVGNLAQNAYQVTLYEMPLPAWFETLVGYTQPFIEIAVGLLLVAGLFTRINGALGAIAMAVFIFGIAWAWAKGLRIDCGCFSVGGELAEGEDTKYLQDIIRDIGLMACGLWLWIRPRSVLAVDNWLLAPVDSGLADDEDLDPIEEDQAAVARR